MPFGVICPINSYFLVLVFCGSGDRRKHAVLRGPHRLAFEGAFTLHAAVFRDQTPDFGTSNLLIAAVLPKCARTLCAQRSRASLRVQDRCRASAKHIADERCDLTCGDQIAHERSSLQSARYSVPCGTSFVWLASLRQCRHKGGD